MKFIPRNNVKGSTIPGLVFVGGKVFLGATGAISSSLMFGCTIVKTAAQTGRYTITLSRPTQKFMGGFVTIIGPDTAALTTTKGLINIFRDDDLGPNKAAPFVTGSANDGTIELQFVQTNAGNADTEVQDNLVFTVVLAVIDTEARG